jgi:tetratricopeptide (TPR) repeat protein
VGKGAAAMKSAQAAFEAGSYDRALSEAQRALRDDPRNRQAERLLENALNGQKAESRMRTAAAALQQGDFAQAAREADSARELAPWDRRTTDLIARIREAQQQAQLEQQQKQAQQQRQAQVSQVNRVLNEADSALAGKQFDQAIKLYDEALKMDPNNVRAGSGRTGAVTARAVAEAAASAGGGVRGATHAFVSGKTQAQSVETRAGAVPEGFEESAGVTVKRGTQAADLPGKIVFEFSPEVVKPFDRYTARIFMMNEGTSPIQIKDMMVTTTINGRKSQGSVPPLTKDVAPRQKAPLLENPDVWKEDTTSWSMEIVVHTTRGETYRNQVTWR